MRVLIFSTLLAGKRSCTLLDVSYYFVLDRTKPLVGHLVTNVYQNFCIVELFVLKIYVERTILYHISAQVFVRLIFIATYH